MAGEVQTFRGPVSSSALGTTLIHEHVFVGHPELDLDLPHPEWCEDVAVETAVAGLERLWDLGVRTVVDLTVLGLGRDVSRVQRVAERTRVHLVASTGYYTADSLPAFFQTHGPGRLVGGPDPLVELFLRDIEVGIAGTGVRAGMLKVVTDRQGLTPDVQRVMEAAATAHRRTGVPITTHTHAPLAQRPRPAGVPHRAWGRREQDRDRALRRLRGPRLPAGAHGRGRLPSGWTDSAWSTSCPTRHGSRPS